MLRPSSVALAVGLLWAASAAYAQQKLYVYPAHGQSPQQQQQDQYQCYEFAKSETGEVLPYYLTITYESSIR